MINLMQEIILDGQEQHLFTGVPRRKEIEVLPQKATVIIGVRRCGKSTWLNQMMQKIISKGTMRENILYLNYSDDRLSTLKSYGLDKVLEAYYLIYPEKKNKEKVYFLFDEIQIIPGWELFVDRIIRTENCEVFISGSSAEMLSKEIATQMRGRSLSWELFPFSFKEFLDAFDVKSELPVSSSQRLTIQNCYESYWERGGFPEVLKCEKHLRIKIHQEYFNSILFRDLIERYDISHPKAVIDLAHRLVNNISTLYTLNNLTNYLQAIGHKVPKDSVAEYLSWFEDAFFLFTVRLFSASVNKSNVNPKKIYCIDHSLVNSVSSGILTNSGHLFENLVYIALRRKSYEIYYFKTENGLEVDFLAINPEGEKLLIQVSESLVSPATRNRELKSVKSAMDELGISSAQIITRNEEELLIVDEKKIEIKPVWRFLLEFS